MNLGSDDIITEDLFKSYDDLFKRNDPMFGSTRLTFIDSKEKECATFDYNVMIGAGRCIRKDILVRYTKDGMYDKIQAGLDMNSAKRFSEVQTVEVENNPNTIYDIKSDTNIWSYKDFNKKKVIDFETGVSGLTTSQIDSILDL